MYRPNPKQENTLQKVGQNTTFRMGLKTNSVDVVGSCDHCEKDILDDGEDSLNRVPGYDDRVCSACLIIATLAVEGEDAKCMSCRNESGAA